MKDWHKLSTELLSEQPYCLTGCDSYPLHHFGTMQRPQPGVPLHFIRGLGNRILQSVAQSITSDLFQLGYAKKIGESCDTAHVMPFVNVDLGYHELRMVACIGRPARPQRNTR